MIIAARDAFPARQRLFNAGAGHLSGFGLGITDSYARIARAARAEIAGYPDALITPSSIEWCSRSHADIFWRNPPAVCVARAPQGRPA